MRYIKINRISRIGFTRATIALIIELAVYENYSYKYLARMFNCSDKTIAMYVKKYYYGSIGKGHKKLIIVRQSGLNDYDRKEAAA